jgi:hypothetical protein
VTVTTAPRPPSPGPGTPGGLPPALIAPRRPPSASVPRRPHPLRPHRPLGRMTSLTTTARRTDPSGPPHLHPMEAAGSAQSGRPDWPPASRLLRRLVRRRLVRGTVSGDLGLVRLVGWVGSRGGVVRLRWIRRIGRLRRVGRIGGLGRDRGRAGLGPGIALRRRGAECRRAPRGRGCVQPRPRVVPPSEGRRICSWEPARQPGIVPSAAHRA